MSPLKRLASQTAIYGVSSVVGRFLNYLLVPLFTYTFAPAEYGVVAELYAYMGFLAVLLTFGLETGYFRFRADGGWAPALVYATVLRVLVLGNLGLLPRPVRLAPAHRGPAALRRAPGVRLVGRGHPRPGLDRGRRLRPADGRRTGPGALPW